MNLDNIRDFDKYDFAEFISLNQHKINNELVMKAHEARTKYFGKKVYVRALIEISNYCKNQCLYCGIQSQNKNIKRYRLSKEEIIDSADKAYELGFRTFVLQGGEDFFYTDEMLVDTIKTIKEKYPNTAITLSLGECDRDRYEKLYNAGADRYLLRHESVNKNHYSFLHNGKQNIKDRLQCLYDLKSIGYQTGVGFMVGSPNQTNIEIGEDLVFIRDFKPAMVGIGPFLSQKDTEFKNYPNGDLVKTITVIALTRIMLPKVLLPTTTALNTLSTEGRNLGFLAGCNVIMPNASPEKYRNDYNLYDNKKVSGTESKEELLRLETELLKLDYKIDYSVGHYED